MNARVDDFVKTQILQFIVNIFKVIHPYNPINRNFKMSGFNFNLFPRPGKKQVLEPLKNASAISDVEMENATYDNLHPFVPEITSGKIVRVYDGDTVTIATRISVDGKEIPKIFRFNVRLLGIDTPELRTKNAMEKALAIKARDALNAYIMNKTVTLQSVSYDKYGRILADVITSDRVNISDWMISNGYAVKYDGGTKHRPTEWGGDSIENP